MADLSVESGGPGLVATLSVNDETLSIPCGEGKQSLRWLANVAAQRYAALHASHGRARQREPTRAATGVFVPKAVMVNTSGTMIGPTTTVKDALAAAEPTSAASTAAPLLAVQLMTAPELADDGSLATTTWSALAFKWSESGRALASKLLDQDAAASAAEAQEKQRREVESKRREVREFLAEIDEAVFLNDKFRLDSLAKQSWPLLKLSLLSEDRLEQLGLKRTIVAKYSIINDVFRYYSSQALVNQNDYTMKFSELRHFLDVTGLLQFPKDAGVLDKWLTVVAPADVPFPKGHEFNQLEFIEVLFLAAKHRFHADACPAFDRLLDTYLSTVVSKVNLGPVRALLGTNEVHRLLPKLALSIHDAILHYSGGTAARDDLRMCLTQTSLTKLLRDACLIASDSAAEQTRLLFETVQEHAPADGSFQLKRLGDVPLMTEMVLSEVLEAVALVSLTRWPGVDVPDVQKVCRGLQVLANLGENPGQSLKRDLVDRAFMLAKTRDDTFITAADVSIVE